MGAAGPSLLPLHTPDIQPSGANLHQAAPEQPCIFQPPTTGPAPHQASARAHYSRTRTQTDRWHWVRPHYREASAPGSEPCCKAGAGESWQVSWALLCRVQHGDHVAVLPLGVGKPQEEQREETRMTIKREKQPDPGCWAGKTLDASSRVQA